MTPQVEGSGPARHGRGSPTDHGPSGSGAARVPHRPVEIVQLLEQLAVRPARALGQSFLCDPFVADMEAALLEAPPGRSVTEIGGGLGLLTEALVRRNLAPLRVLEVDPRLADHLRARFEGRVQVERSDARTASFAPGDIVVGNLPFSMSAPIIERLFSARVSVIVALLQREVGRRYCARPPSSAYGRPSIQAALYGSAELFAPVPSTSFYPVPQVDGVLVRFRARVGPLPVSNVPRFTERVRRLFAHRRKQLGNILPNLAGGEQPSERIARAAGWPDKWRSMRPGELPPEAYFALDEAWSGPIESTDVRQEDPTHRPPRAP